MYRLGDEVSRAELQRGQAGLFAVVAGDEQHRDVRQRGVALELGAQLRA